MGARRLVSTLLDWLVRYVPDVEPLSFDSARSARWAVMVETAELVSPDATESDVAA